MRDEGTDKNAHEKIRENPSKPLLPIALSCMAVASLLACSAVLVFRDGASADPVGIADSRANASDTASSGILATETAPGYMPEKVGREPVEPMEPETLISLGNTTAGTSETMYMVEASEGILSPAELAADPASSFLVDSDGYIACGSFDRNMGELVETPLGKGKVVAKHSTGGTIVLYRQHEEVQG